MMTVLSRREALSAALGGAAASAFGFAGRADAADIVNSGVIEAMLDRDMAIAKILGLAVTVMRRGVQQAMFLRGKASLPFDAPVSERTLFHTGSVGKHTVAIGILRMQDAGLVSLDGEVGRYVKDVPDRWAKLPIRNLLGHTSGMPDYGSGFSQDRPYSRKDLFALGDQPMQFECGSLWNYSNTAFTLLGQLIEDISGMSYARYVREEVFGRAGLKDSRPDDAQSPIPYRSEPYEWRDGAFQHAVRMSSSVSHIPAGGLLMSPRDQPAWALALTDGRLLSPASTELMYRPGKLNNGATTGYGLAWFLDILPGGRRIVWHTGSVPGYRTVYYRIPETGFSMMVQANAGTDRLFAIAQKVAEAFEPGSTTLSLNVIRDGDRAATARARSIILRNTPLTVAGFTPDMARFITERGDRAVPRYDAFGSVGAFDLVQESVSKFERWRRYRATFTDHVRYVSVGNTPDGAIFLILAR